MDQLILNLDFTPGHEYTFEASGEERLATLRVRMVEQGKISVDDAEKLLSALEGNA